MRACGIISSWALLAGMVVIATTSRSGAQSAVGTAFTYQGELTQMGAAANGEFDLVFVLHDAEIGGTSFLPTVTLEDVSVSGGRFSAVLDFGAGIFGAEARWVEIGVRPGAETGAFTVLAPRQRITPSPVAIHAARAGDADLLDGMDSMDFADAAHMHNGAGNNSLDASDGDPAQAVFVDADGNTGIGTTAPTAGLHVAKGGPSFFDAQLLAEIFDGDGTFNRLLSPRSVFVSGTTAYVASSNDDSLTLLDFITRPRYLEVGGDTLISGGVGPVRLTLEADTDRTGDLARIAMRQDGGAMRATPGFSLGSVDFQIAAGSEAGSDILLMSQGNVGIRTTNPVYPLEVGTNPSNGNGAHVTAGGIWANGSDRNSKTGFTPIDPQAILERLATLPVTEWRYPGEPEEIRHVGPTAQDFMEAFGPGASERHIGTIDADGIALAAIQGLRDLVLQENAALRSQNDRLEARLAKIEAALACPKGTEDSTPR